MSGLESLSKIASEAIVDLHAEDSAEEADEGDLSDVEAPNEHGDHFHPLGDNSANPNPGNEKESRIDADVMHWRSQIAEPLYYFPTGADKEVNIIVNIIGNIIADVITTGSTDQSGVKMGLRLQV